MPPVLTRRRVLASLFGAWVAVLLGAASLLAGGGPENVLLVVNQASHDSLTVANYYVRLREIPSQNVLYVNLPGSPAAINGRAFLKKILQPALDAIDSRRLGNQIDYIVYSCDLPTRINLQEFFPGEDFPKAMRPVASITGATCLWRLVMQKSPSLMALDTNWYVPGPRKANLSRCAALAETPSRGFRSSYQWDAQGRRTEEGGRGYFLSAVLGVTQPHGNTAEEVARLLVRSHAADYTRPDGTFYFLQNKNVRSTTRHRCYPAVASMLEREGARARVLTGQLPKNARDILGLTGGVRKAYVAGAGLAFRPGAIAEHLTSFGGVLDKQTGQTRLSELISAGASAASGTVIEPLAIQAKFPLPTLHLHYYRGCSLGEAFYQSVAAPYQLLVVGDPLCQPWAESPSCLAPGLTEGQSVAGPLALRPEVSADVRECEVYIDGVLRAVMPSCKTLTLDSTKLVDGRHEVRLVAARSDSIETRGRVVVGVEVDNQPGGPITLTSVRGPRIAAGQAFTVRASGAGARWVIRQNSRTIGHAKGTPAELRIDSADLGRGPVRLEAIDPVSGGRSAPLWVWVQ